MHGVSVELLETRDCLTLVTRTPQHGFDHYFLGRRDLLLHLDVCKELWSSHFLRTHQRES